MPFFHISSCAHLPEAVDVFPTRVSVQLDALPLLLQLVDGLFALSLDVVH